MRMDKLTSRFQQALADAQSLAVGRDNSIIEPVHVFSALLDQQGGSTRPLLAQAGVNVPVLRERLDEALEALPKVSGQAGNLSIGNDLNRLLNHTDKLAQQNGDAFIASEWFVLAALEDTENALLSYAKRQAQLKLRLEQSVAARRAAELAEVRYRAGSSDFLTLLDAQRSQLAADDALAQAEAGVNVGVVAIYKSLGGGGEQDIAPALAAQP